MKRVVMKVSLVFGILVMLVFLIVHENRNELWSDTPQLFFVAGNEVITPWYSKTDDTYYLFLPSCVNIEEVKLTSYSEDLIYKENAQDKAYCSLIKNGSLSDKMLGCPLDCQREKSKDVYGLVILQSANLPAVFIDTASGSVEKLKESKDYEETATIRIYDDQGQLILNDSVKKMKGRGNTSFNGYDKKPWNLDLEKPADLFGMGLDQKYTLIANASDPTLVRNDYMRRLEDALQIHHVHVGQFVDLYINSEYQGNYYLCSPVNVGEDRVDIFDMEKQSLSYVTKSMLDDAPVYESVEERLTTDDSETYDGARKDLHNKAIKKGLILPSVDQAIESGKIDVTGGYLLERDYEHRYLTEYEENASSFVTKNGECFRVKSPLYCSEMQINYIASFVEEAETALLAEDGINPDTGLSYSDYIDVDSFVKRYLAEEISKNYDGGVSSTYFYKDCDSKDSKLHMAPGWDYDMCLGNYVEWMADISENPEGLTKLSVHSYPCLWFEKLYDRPEYYEKVISYFHQYAAPFLFEETIPLIEAYQEQLGASIRMNHIRWANELNQNFQYKDVESSYADFQNFVMKRARFLEQEWEIH